MPIPPIHGAPYRFIDEVVRYEAGSGITCKTLIHGNEPYFAGHFPAHPILPGVFEIEMLFQAAELFLILETGAGRDGAMRPASVKSARFMSPILPPRAVTITVDVKQAGQSERLFTGRLSDGPDTFVQASFSVTV